MKIYFRKKRSSRVSLSCTSQSLTKVPWEDANDQAILTLATRGQSPKTSLWATEYKDHYKTKKENMELVEKP